MAEKCGNCGRADLLQPDVVNYHCLACGALTSIATGQVVRNDVPNVMTAPSGHPIIELSTGQQVDNPYDFPQEAVAMSDVYNGPARTDASAEAWRAEQEAGGTPEPEQVEEPVAPVEPTPEPVPEPAPVEPAPVAPEVPNA